MIAAVTEETVSPAVTSPGVVAAGHTPTQATVIMNETHNNISRKKAASFQETNSVPQTYTANAEDDTNKGYSSYWYLLLTTYAPIIALWFWTSLLKLANVIHTLVVGQLVKLVVVEDISKWMSETIPPWLEVILFQSASPNNTLKASSSDHAWPPPALKALALLTIMALVVHPEGLTWVLLGKLRDAIYAFFSALGNSVEFLLNDYGVFPTIIAATTLGAMFFLAFVVIRTLSPKKGKNYSDKHNNTLHSERRKKKKKGGNARHRNNHRSNNNNNSRIKSTRRSRSQDVENKKVETDSTTGAIPCSPIPSPVPADVPENDTLSFALSSPLEKPLDSPLEVPSLSTTTASDRVLDNNTIESSQESAKNVPTDKSLTPVGFNKSASKENHINTNKTRRRVASASTADTTPLSDDHSCGSTSVRSFPSVSVNSNRSGGKKTKNTTPRRLKRHGTVKSPKNTERNSGKKHNGNLNNHATSVESPGTTSRWDALKPNNGNAGKNNNSNSKNSTHGGHYSHSNGTTGNNKKQNQRQRGNSRRAANGRKGRPHPKSLSQNEDPSAVSDTLRVNQGRANTESPRIGSMRQESKNSCPDNPFAPSASRSSPPPGFQNSSHYEFGTKSSSHQYSQEQQYTNDNLVAAPFFGTPLRVRSPQDGSSNIAGMSPTFFNNSESTARTIQENPFRSDVPAISGSLSMVDNHSYQQRHHQANLDSQIEADLQELGGQMAGSILDF